MIVHLVDGTYELFRYFLSPRAAFDRSAPPELRAVRGVVGSILGMLEGGATHLGVATDHVIESFRNALWPGYKTGEGMDPVLYAQFEPLEEALRALGVVVWPMVEFEADDALAAAAAMAAADARVEQVVICTPDKDLAQCVRGDRVVQLDRRRDEQRDEAGVVKKFGVPPASIPDWLALVGDSADGFPGLPGWGATSAATVLARYGHLERIPERGRGLGRAGARRGAPGLDARRAGRARAAVPHARHAARGRADRRRRGRPAVGGPRPEFAAWAERLGTPALHRARAPGRGPRGGRAPRDARVTPPAAAPGAPGRAPPPRLPSLLERAARLADRDVDAERGPGVARAGADRVAVPARAGDRAAVHADPAALAGGRRAERPLSQAPHHPADPGGDDGAGLRAGRARLERPGALLARGGARRDLRPRAARWTSRRGSPTSRISSGRADLPNAVALNSLVFNGARIVGPAVAGLLIARFGVALAFFAERPELRRGAGRAARHPHPREIRTRPADSASGQGSGARSTMRRARRPPRSRSPWSSWSACSCSTSTWWCR